MNKDYFKDIYKDFFIDSSINREESVLDNGIDSNKLLESIQKLYISDESKKLLVKVINYMERYSKDNSISYIPFNIIIESINNDVRKNIEDIIYKACKMYSYIDVDKKCEYSLYDGANKIDYFSFGFISIIGLSGINLEDDSNRKKFYYKLEEFLKGNSKTITVVCGNSNEISSFFLGNENIKNNYFLFNIKCIKPSVQDVYQYILDNIDDHGDMRIKLLDYINLTYDKSDDYVKYRDDLIKYISFNNELPKIEESKSLDEIFFELHELVGLDKVKKVLYDLVDVVNLKNKARDSLKIKDINMHMVFLGNPGTGKTTVARIVSGILYNLGYIKEDKLIEVSVKDLVAEYVGQTAPKTMGVIEKSLNGVLFIDEAYALSVKENNSYNAEAIATLIQAMENYRDKLVVIFAGYTKEMRDFLDSNSGIVSRIGYTLEFDDYTTKELIQIFIGMTDKSGFIVEDEAIKYLEDIINKYRNMKNFGNARFIRNIYEKTVIKHASNTKDNKQKKKLITITKDDISIDNLILE